MKIIFNFINSSFNKIIVFLKNPFGFLWVILFCYMSLIFLSFKKPELFKEDQFVENIEAILCLNTSLLAFFKSFSNSSWGRYYKAFYINIAFVFLFLFFEEINYGQRIIEYHFPRIIAFLNEQGEFNIHNIFRGSIEVFGGFLLLLWIIFSFSKKKYCLKNYRIPPLSYSKSFIIIFILFIPIKNYCLYSVFGEIFLALAYWSLEIVETLIYLYFLLLLIPEPQEW